MRTFPKLILSMFVVACVTASSAQTKDTKDLDTAQMVQGATPGYARVTPKAVDLTATPLTIDSSTILKFPVDAATSGDAATSRAAFTVGNNAADSNAADSGGGSAAFSRTGRDDDEGRRADVSTIDGIDSLATFSGVFMNQAGPSKGRLFPFIMIGNHPLAGGRTVIPAQMTTVNLTLLNADGSLNANVPFSFRHVVEDSPNFEEANYRSGRHIQYGDAIHRAQFFHTMGEDWHTVLRPRFVNDVTFTIPRFVNVQFADGSVKAVQAYRLGTAPDGTHFVLMLDLLFNFLFDNQVVSDIIAGNFTTNALSTTLFPNTFLFSIDNNGQFAGCCVLGFHTFFSIAGAVPQPRWVTQFASWISPGIFGGGFQDVTALSHETSEAFADPFVNNTTASWQFPGVPPTAKICQSNLEEGDPIEVLANATVPITLRERREVFTYHPQIIPLLQWFEMGTTSNAIDGAFSFPVETTLPHSALPCPK